VGKEEVIMASLFSMHPQQQVCLWINVIGGLAVILSYILPIVTHQGNSEVLWGGISGGLRNFYLVSMLLAALSYFAFTYFILFRMNPETVHVFQVMNFIVFPIIYCFILIASALWMPLTYAMVGQPQISLWIGIRAVLLIVGLSALCLVIALLGLSPRPGGVAYWLAVTGSILFCLHTLVLDGMIWPAFFQTQA
jgi:hypothetical protein